MFEPKPLVQRRAAERSEGEVWTSVRRDAWRIQLFQEQIAFEAVQRANAAALHRAVLLGVAVGVVGSLLTHLQVF